MNSKIKKDYTVYGKTSKDFQIFFVGYTKCFSRVTRGSIGKSWSVVELARCNGEIEAIDVRQKFIEKGRKLGWPLRNKIYKLKNKFRK